MMRKFAFFRTRPYAGLLAVAAIIIVVVAGTVFLMHSHAASSEVAAEPETGTITAPATVVADTAASNSKAIKFGVSMITPPSTTTGTAVSVVNGQLVNGQGKALRLIGVDVTGTEDACIQNNGFSWGPLNATEAAVIASWHINAVRIPMNEDCWLGINGAPAAYSGTNYQNAIKAWVTALNNAGIVTILDLQWTAPGTSSASRQYPMADADHSVTFWSQVSKAYASDPGVIYDLFNEPYLGQSHPVASDWSCWLNGCTNTTQDQDASNGTVSYTTAGMQAMVNAVRASGATQPIMVGGLDWSGDPCAYSSGGGAGAACTEIKDMPTDPAKQLVISFHTYSGQACPNATCWGDVASSALAAKIPVITGEIGDNDGGSSYITQYMAWADQNNISYLAWAWQAGSSQFDLVTDWNGTPNSPEGPVLKTHFALEGL
jgi:endoglucanase